MPTAPRQAEQSYEQRVALQTRGEQQLEAVDRRLTRARVAVFALFVLLVAGAFAAEDRAFWIGIAGIVFIAFVGLVGWHDAIERRLGTIRLIRRLAEEGLARQQRQWSSLPVLEGLDESLQATGHDLDLTGRNSLLQLLCPAGTGLGQAAICRWMAEPLELERLHRRQTAVSELRDEPAIRDKLQLLGCQVRGGRTGPAQFVAWAEGAPWLSRRNSLRWLTRLSPILGVVLCVLVGFQAIPPWIGLYGLLGVLAFNALLSVVYTGSVQDIFGTVSSRHQEAAKYVSLFELIVAERFDADALTALQQRLATDREDVVGHLRRLQRIMRAAHISRSPVLFLLLYVPLQLTLLWDFHVLAVLERWQVAQADRAAGWFAVLAEFEALAGLATFAAEHPDWVVPTVDASVDRLIATELGHPLLPAETRVCNDVTVGPPGSFLLVTGSNMSGKSTLLRSLGTNAVLAKLGAPVCAATMSLPPLEVATSMRVEDSLADGVSFFMAELRRLKQIVDTARAMRDRTDVRLLYLLDEILQGTNSRERQIAVARVVQHLLDCGAVGAISTHDVELANLDGLMQACRPVHFRETLTAGSGMTFDYRMREGVATTTNALKLLEVVGLGES